MKLFKFNNLNIQNISYKPPKEDMVTNSMLSDCKYKEKSIDHSIKINLPLLKFLRLYKKKKICYFELELDETCDEIYNFFTDIDIFNINTIKDNYNLWFDANLEKDKLVYLENMYESIIDIKDNINTTIKFTIDINNCEIFDQYEKPIKLSQLKEKEKVLLTIVNKGLRFFQKYTYNEWQITKIRIYPDYLCLLNSDIDDESNDEYLSENGDNIEKDYNNLDLEKNISDTEILHYINENTHNTETETETENENNSDKETPENVNTSHNEINETTSDLESITDLNISDDNNKDIYKNELINKKKILLKKIQNIELEKKKI